MEKLPWLEYTGQTTPGILALSGLVANRPWVLMKRLLLVITDTQQAGIQPPPKYAFAPRRK
jgi:hypothetical protein